MTQSSQASPAEAGPHQRGRALARPGLFRFSVSRFLVALVLLFVTSPFFEEIKNGALVESALATVVMCMGGLAVGGRRRTLILAVILVLPAVLGNWANHIWP